MASFVAKDCRITTYDSRGDQSASVGMRFEPKRWRGDDGEVGFVEVGGTTSDFDNVVKLSRISPAVS